MNLARKSSRATWRMTSGRRYFSGEDMIAHFTAFVIRSREHGGQSRPSPTRMQLLGALDRISQITKIEGRPQRTRSEGGECPSWGSHAHHLPENPPRILGQACRRR